MRKLLASALLISALSIPAIADGTIQTGDGRPTPPPPPPPAADATLSSAPADTESQTVAVWDAVLQAFVVVGSWF